MLTSQKPLTLFSYLNAIYSKSKINTNDLDTGICITLNKWLGFNKNVVSTVKDLTNYTFYLEPLYYYYLLYFSIPVGKAPFIKNIKKEDKEENPLLNKLCYVLGWSLKEAEKNREILDVVIFNRADHWKAELGVS